MRTPNSKHPRQETNLLRSRHRLLGAVSLSPSLSLTLCLPLPLTLCLPLPLTLCLPLPLTLSRLTRPRATSIKMVLRRLRGLQTIDVSVKLDDLAEKIRRLALPVGHGLDGVRVAGRKLTTRRKEISQHQNKCRFFFFWKKKKKVTENDEPYSDSDDDDDSQQVAWRPSTRCASADPPRRS